MQNDQLVKRVEWLDKERLDDKNTISELKERIEKLESALEKSAEFAGELSSQINRLNVVVEKVDKFEATLSNYAKDVKKELDAQDKRRKKREREVHKTQRFDLDEINKKLVEFSEGLKEIEKTKIEIKDRKAEEKRLGKSIAKIKDSLDEIHKSEEVTKRKAESLADIEQKDARRIADLQADVAVLRKRLDEFGGKMELVLSDQHKIDARLIEFQSAEIDRRESQTTFTEKIIRSQSDRDHEWKDWNKRFDTIEKQSEQLASHLKNISDTERAVEKAQEIFNNITEQLDRRINEITEMQRLGEERFRQEFATFKADDQKRWTNYMLTQEELQKESTRQLERLFTQTNNLEDTLQEMQDVLQHLGDQTEKRLKTMLANMREWVAENEKFLGSMS